MRCTLSQKIIIILSRWTYHPLSGWIAICGNKIIAHGPKERISLKEYHIKVIKNQIQLAQLMQKFEKFFSIISIGNI